MCEILILFTIFAIIVVLKSTIYEISGVNIVMAIVGLLEMVITHWVLVTGLFGFIGAIRTYLDSQYFGIPFQFTKTTFSHLIQEVLESIFVLLAMMVAPMVIARQWQENYSDNIVLFIIFSLLIASLILMAQGACLSQFTIKKVRILEVEKQIHRVMLIILNLIIALALMYVVVNVERIFDSSIEVTFLNLIASAVFIVYITIITVSMIKKIFFLAFGEYMNVDKCKDVSIVEFDNRKYFLALEMDKKVWAVLSYKESTAMKKSKIFKNEELVKFEFTKGEFIVKNIEGMKITVVRDVLLREKSIVGG